MSKNKVPLMRMCYQHFSGKVFVTVGISKGFKEDEEEIVVLSACEDMALWHCPVSKFFDIHPQLQVPRFQLAMPTITAKVIND